MPLIEDLETSIEELREHLGLRAESNGKLFGKIVIEDEGRHAQYAIRIVHFTILL